MLRLTISLAAVFALTAVADPTLAQTGSPAFEGTKIEITFENQTTEDVALSYRKASGVWKFFKMLESGDQVKVRTHVGREFAATNLDPTAADMDFRATATEDGERFAIGDTTSTGPEVVEIGRVRQLETQLFNNGFRPAPLNSIGSVEYGRRCPPNNIGGPEYGRPLPHNNTGIAGYGNGTGHGGHNPIQQWGNFAAGVASLFNR